MLQAVVGHEMVEMGVTENYAGDWPVKTLLTDVIQKLNWISFFPEKLLLEVNMDDHFLKEYANISIQRSRSFTNEDQYAWECCLRILDKEISKYDFFM